MITDLMNKLGPDVTVTYIGQEDYRWWVEIRLPESRYDVALVTEWGYSAGQAFENTVAKALGYRREARAA